jgi:predicted DNA-binding protein (UPF0251 family)
MSALYELLSEFTKTRANGRAFTPEEIVQAVITLEPQQAEAMCQVLWALPLECVLFYVQKGNAEAIAKREGYNYARAGRQMNISATAVRNLVERAKPNILAWLLTPVR